MKKSLFAVCLAIVFFIPGCATRDVIDIALSKNPEQALKKLAERRVSAYKYDPELVIADIKRGRSEYNRIMAKFQKETGKKWGKKEAEEVPTKTRYVKYTEGYKNRTVVDFDSGTVRIEHLEDDKVKDKLKSAVVTTLLTPGDPRAVDLFSDKPIELNGAPYLQGMVADQNDRLINGREEAERYADYLVNNKLQLRTIDANGQSKKVSYVQFDMINTHVDKRARKFAPMVTKHAETTQVSRSLVYAVIKTESSFNPFARSDAPAYGLMQLVPYSGGRDAYRKVKGEDASPSEDYLYDAENNIELGATYLSILMNDSPLSRIDDPVSREYCAIAAYNTGPGNVFKAFAGSSKKTDEALAKINSMKPDEVYDWLRQKLPYDETRGYVVKVVNAKKQFAKM